MCTVVTVDLYSAVYHSMGGEKEEEEEEEEGEENNAVHNRAQESKSPLSVLR